MTDLAARLTVALAERYALERELGQGGMAVLSRTTLFNVEQYEIGIPHANYDVDPSGKRFVMVAQLD